MKVKTIADGTGSQIVELLATRISSKAEDFTVSMCRLDI
jgi:hypothetical protein